MQKLLGLLGLSLLLSTLSSCGDAQDKAVSAEMQING
jgi:hypothetical protein